MSATVKRVSKCPCKGCTERYVIDGRRCHSDCERYKNWKKEFDDAANHIREEHMKTTDADFLLTQRSIRYRKAIRRIPKKKG